LSQPRVTLEMTGRVRAAVIADPSALAMGDMSKAEGKLPTHLPVVNLATGPGQSFEITKAETNSAFLKPTLSPLDGGPKGRYRVTTEIDPAIPAGKLSGIRLTLQTTNPKKPTVVIPITGQIHAGEVAAAERPLRLYPPALSFDLFKPGETRVAKLKLTRPSSWEIVRTDAAVRGAAVEVSFAAAGPDYEVTVTVKAPTETYRGFRGYVDLIAAESKRPPKVRIPVSGWTYG